MKLIASPRARWPFWFFLVLGWSVISGSHIFLSIQRQEPQAQIIFITTSIFFVGIINTLLQREAGYRLKIYQSESKWTWILHCIISSGFGLLSALIIILCLSYFYIFMGYTKSFVFFSIYVYPNWLFFSLTHGLAAAIYTVTKHYKRLRIEKQQNFEIALQLKESQVHALSANLNPHFLFNSINNIRSLILENPNKAREMLTSLSEILRQSLKFSSKELISLKEELTTVKNYIELCKIQYEKRLRYSEKLRVNAEEHSIPPMLIQLLVENAIKHGIDKNKEGGEINVVILSSNGQLIIETTNPAASSLKQNNISQDKPAIGIANIEERLRLIYGEAASFEIKIHQSIVNCRISLPIQHENNHSRRL